METDNNFEIKEHKNKFTLKSDKDTVIVKNT